VDFTVVVINNIDGVNAFISVYVRTLSNLFVLLWHSRELLPCSAIVPVNVVLLLILLYELPDM